MPVVLSARAEAELESIFNESFERWGEAQARRYAEQVDQRFVLLTKIAGAGRARPELGDGVRSTPVGAHIIFFKMLDDSVLILSLRHAKRRLPDLGDIT